MSENLKRTGRFCTAPFASLNTRGHGEARVCCTISGINEGIPKNATIEDINDDTIYHKLEKYNLSKDSIEDLWNSKFMKDFRMKMIQGEYIKNCEGCFRLEDSGLTSKRTSRNRLFLNKFKEEGVFSKVEKEQGFLSKMPEWWEIRLSTNCNLSCYMCTPRLSSKIYRDYLHHKEEIGPKDKDNIEALSTVYLRRELKSSQFFKEQFFKNIENVRILEMRGGEVFFDKKSTEFLKEVSQTKYAEQISLDISTNATILTPEIIKSINRFKKGQLRFSIDSFGDEDEYLRYPTKWKHVEDNLEKSKQIKPEIRKLIQVTLNIFQVCTIEKLLWYIDDLVRKGDHDFFWSFTLVRGRPHLLHEILPIELRKDSVQKVHKFLNNSYMCNKHRDKEIHSKDIKALIKTIVSEKELPREDLKKIFRETIEPLDKIRKLNYLETFPHLECLTE